MAEIEPLPSPFFVVPHFSRVMDDQTPHAPAETQSIEDYISTENAREQSGELSTPDQTPEPLPPKEPPPDDDEKPVAASGDRNADGTFKRRPTNAEARHDPKARIQQQAWDQREAKRERDEARAEVARLRAEFDAFRAPKAEPPPQAQPTVQSFVDPNDPEPNPDDLDKYADGQFDRKYLKDQARWEARQELKQNEFRQHQLREARAHHQAEEAHQRELQTRAGQFHERIAPLVAADPEWLNQVNEQLINAYPLSALPPDQRGRATFANFLAEQVWDSEHPKELLLHLSDETEVQRLATLPPDRVIKEIAKFEARLGAAPAASAPARISHAKRPIEPLGSSPQHADSPPDDRAPVETHIAYWNARDKAAAR